MLNSKKQISLKKVRVHNLKSVDLTLNRDELIVFTGVSGSGKSSLAFDTIHIEGQRRYVESLSTYARRQLKEMQKPDIEHATGIGPTIAIEQKTIGRNPRSTVGTMTEILDYLRVLYARIGIPYCPISGEKVTPQNSKRIIKTVQNQFLGKKIIIFSPYAKEKKGEFKEDFLELLKRGYSKLRIDGKIVDLNDRISLDGNARHNIDLIVDRLNVAPENFSRLAESITRSLEHGKGISSVFDIEKKDETLFSEHAYSAKSGIYYSSLEPKDFSFNSPSGACTSCQGLGRVTSFDLDKIIIPDLSIKKGAVSIASSYNTVYWGNVYDNLARIYNFKVNTPWKKLPEKAKHIFLYGTEKKWTRMRFVHPKTGSFWFDLVPFAGVLKFAHKRFNQAKSDSYKKKMRALMREQECPDCKGERIKKYPAIVKFQGKTIGELTSLTHDDLWQFFNNINLSDTEMLIADELIKEIKSRLHFLIEVGLHYLTLDRSAPSLSGGEAQRVRLASTIGCGLVGITYVLDEPSIGLHPRDNLKLINSLKTLRDVGNTVIVVEHDEETILSADRIVDLGIGAGTNGGQILVNGSLQDLLKNQESITSQYLSGQEKIPIPQKRKKATGGSLIIKGAAHHNLKNLNVKIPLGLFIAVTGVSGSGKSSLITETLYPAVSNHLHASEANAGKHKKILGLDKIDKIIAIDQSPIGRNPRSNPTTYIKLLDDIRELFSELNEAKAKGYSKGRFSFNVKAGSCPKCLGLGEIKIDMDFLEDAYIDCPECKKRRFDAETLSVYYKGKNIYDILEMEVSTAASHFKNIPIISKKLDTLKRVGLDYIKLGQPSTTLSGGEAQRIKLAKELVRPSTGKTLYILDEPTSGLHFHDIKKLLNVLHELTDRGNTVIIIEHNMDIVKTADWIIDLGPFGGAEGGKIVATGSPEKIAKLNTPTGQAVKKALHHKYQTIQSAKDIKKVAEPIKDITILGACQNNLKHLNVQIPREKITVLTGPSGSGKSSLAFDTIYAEGQRRYIESLSPYARQFVHQMPKPIIESAANLSPAIAIEQKQSAGNPRSTVGTMTEIYDYLRLLWARLGIPHCPETGEVIRSISKDFICQKTLERPLGEKIQILAPIEILKNESIDHAVSRLSKLGFVRVRLNGQFFSLDQKELIEAFDKKRKNELLLVIDRLIIKDSIQSRLFEAIEKASEFGNNKLFITAEKRDIFYNLSNAAEKSGVSYPEITTHTFSFNSPAGCCPDCIGLGVQWGADFSEKRDILNQTPTQLLQNLWKDKTTKEAIDCFKEFLKGEKIDCKMPLLKLPQEKLHLIMSGSNKLYESNKGYHFQWIGVSEVLTRAGKTALKAIKEPLKAILDEQVCLACQGTRLNPLALHVTIKNFSIAAFCSLPIDQAFNFIKKIKIPENEKLILEEIKKQILNRLSFLIEIGLEYISLDRKAPSISGGEAQRIRLARQLGSGLTCVTYVLDEPTIGLHPQNIYDLNKALKKLQNLGNTLILVEHDPATIEIADYIIDFGPHSGRMGGYITAQGTLSSIKKNKKSLTGQFLSGKKKVPIPEERRLTKGKKITITKAKIHNLKNITIDIPTKTLTCLTGVSGSGKSTILQNILKPAFEKGLLIKDKMELKNIATVSGLDNFDKFGFIDQNPPGHTHRSNVCTYVDLLTHIRQFFASLPLALTKGLLPCHFSYNHRKGMCTSCLGMGYKNIEMYFLPAVKVVCDQCGGNKLNPTSLQIKYKNKNLGEHLKTTVEEAKINFENFPRIKRILDTLISCGLGYLLLGQEIPTLSGGEAQRIKLSKELAKRSHGKTLYLLDEPTTGLHSSDIEILLKVIHKLVDKGNTVIAIEHNLDFIKNADYLIDLGPGAGVNGGEVLFSGRPEDLLKCKKSPTAKFLKNVL